LDKAVAQVLPRQKGIVANGKVGSHEEKGKEEIILRRPVEHAIGGEMTGGGGRTCSKHAREKKKAAEQLRNKYQLLHRGPIAEK